MIKNQYLIPECYVQKIPYCDVCDIALQREPIALTSYPPQYSYVCPSCGKQYTYMASEVEGEWKWRTI